jgi:hypothetical protein
MKINFVASLPMIQSALSVGGDGARLKLDIPETDIAEVIKMVMLKGKAFKVTIEVDDSQDV